MTAEIVRIRLEENRIPYRPELPELLRVYLDLLQDWNTRMDLTAVLEEDELLDKHFIDSLTVLKGPLQNTEKISLIDVGTGAGFPGMVLALACPDWQVTLLDSQRKRIDFLQAVAEKTGAGNVTLLHSRAEDGAVKPSLRERFDVAAARAVAPLNVLCELLLPYVRVGGTALCWKGPALQEEMEKGRRAAFLLGGKIQEPVVCPVAGRDWEHLILPIRKTNPTPRAYPRKAGTPKSKPLGE